MVTLTPLDAAFGVEMHGVRLADDFSDPVMRTLVDALHVHRVIVIRDQDLDEDRFLRFGRLWGDPIPHVLDHMRMDGYPELMTVGNTEERDRDAKIRNGAALWHTDQSYEEVPASATMLYSILAPREGGETQFCDMAGAYDSLDAATRERIDSLEVAHKYGRGRRLAGEAVVNPIINDDQDRRVPPVHHPLVMRHPVTGRKALYAIGHGAYAIRDMTSEEAGALLDSLKAHALCEEHIYRHHYRPGDLVIWDTLQTMHAASPIAFATSRENARLLWRISVRGLPQVLSRTV